MRIIKCANHKMIVKEMRKEATKKFNACNPEKCPRCRVSDG